MSLKIATIVGTRPEIIRLSRILNAFDNGAEHILIHTGQNFSRELNDIFFQDLKIKKPDFQLNCAGPNSVVTIANILKKTYQLLKKIKPDAVFILGDTNSALSAYSAKRLKIPIFHYEAGNRCFDDRVPEEINRRIVDHVSDINLTYSSISREYLLKEGMRPEKVFKIGSPLNEVYNYYKKRIDNSKILENLNIHSDDFFLLSCHREENLDSKNKFKDFQNTIKLLEKKFNKKVIITTHPRTKNKLKNNINFFNSNIEFCNPFSFTEYCKLQLNAYAVISDSGSIAEESSILGINSINIRDSHERPEAIEKSPIILSSMKFQDIESRINLLRQNKLNRVNVDNKVLDYDEKYVSEKILKIIYSYTDYVNREVWKKY